jgi:hypothetical protein
LPVKKPKRPETIADLWGILQQARRVWPDAVIAGGSIRDAILGRPMKDVDVWVNAATYDNEHTDMSGMDLGDVRQVEERYEKSDNRIVIYSSEVFPLVCRRLSMPIPNITVEVIGLLGTSNPTDEFDFGINMAYMDGNGLRTPPAFLKDWNTKTLHVNRARTRPLEGERIDLMREKFPDWGMEL